MCRLYVQKKLIYNIYLINSYSILPSYTMLPRTNTVSPICIFLNNQNNKYWESIAINRIISNMKKLTKIKEEIKQLKLELKL